MHSFYRYVTAESVKNHSDRITDLDHSILRAGLQPPPLPKMKYINICTFQEFTYQQRIWHSCQMGLGHSVKCSGMYLLHNCQFLAGVTYDEQQVNRQSISPTVSSV